MVFQRVFRCLCVCATFFVLLPYVLCVCAYLTVADALSSGRLSRYRKPLKCALVQFPFTAGCFTGPAGLDTVHASGSCDDKRFSPAFDHTGDRRSCALCVVIAASRSCTQHGLCAKYTCVYFVASRSPLTVAALGVRVHENWVNHPRREWKRALSHTLCKSALRRQ